MVDHELIEFLENIKIILLYFSKIRILGQKGKEDQMAFALKMANETLVQLEEAFDIAYPMQKLGMHVYWLILCDCILFHKF